MQAIIDAAIEAAKRARDFVSRSRSRNGNARELTTSVVVITGFAGGSGRLGRGQSVIRGGPLGTTITGEKLPTSKAPCPLRIFGFIPLFAADREVTRSCSGVTVEIGGPMLCYWLPHFCYGFLCFRASSKFLIMRDTSSIPKQRLCLKPSSSN